MDVRGAYAFEKSKEALARAKRSIPSGVTSAARVLGKPTPLFVERAHDVRLWDADGQEYIDYVMGFGPLLLGHTPPTVIDAVSRQLSDGFLYGSAHSKEAEFAEALVEHIPCAERVLFSNTGSEAVHMALRLARVHTKRRLIVKFEGCYHGWFDPVCYGTPGQLPVPSLQPAVRPHMPSTAGIAPNNPDLIILPFNHEEALEQLFAIYGDDIAAVIMEVVPQAGAIKPTGSFLKTVRQQTEASASILIFDEVITGFRMGIGGAQTMFGVTPDMNVMGKAIGAGYPISAITGRADILNHTELGRTPHMGTFNGHALNVAAGLAAMERYATPGFYQELHQRSARLAGGLQDAINKADLGLKVSQCGALISVVGLSHDAPLDRYSDLVGGDGALVAKFSEALLRHGVNIQARGTLMPSSAHTDDDISETLERVRLACASIQH